MKKNFLKTCLLALVLTALSLGVQAQGPGSPPPPPTDPTGGGNNGPVGGGAPIAEGMMILTLLAAGYGVKKYRQSRDVEE
jgi:Spy/CpxP family protein refolding chaperone